MKTLIITLALLLSGHLFSQNEPNLFSVSLTQNVPVLYRGFDNHIRLRKSENDTTVYIIFGTNCSISRIRTDDELSDEFIIRPGKADSAIITISKAEGTINKKIKSQVYLIQNLPTPAVSIDNISTGNSIPREINLIQVKYDKGVPLDLKYDVLGWTMLIDGAIYTGNNYMPSDEVKALVKELPSGTKIDLIVNCKGRNDGLEYKFKGEFKLD